MTKPILVETSARHVHLSIEDLYTLFGNGYELRNKKDLSQPGQFASFERVDIIGPKKTITGVTVLGPVRKVTQVEISLTDARSIGIIAPIRESGDLEDTPSCTLAGPVGTVVIPGGVIVAKRHIHMTFADAKEYGVKDKDIVSVKLSSNGRETVFGDTVVRVSENFSLAMHIDTDEANAVGGMVTEGEIIR